jgi:hypothetical protein
MWIYLLRKYGLYFTEADIGMINRGLVFYGIISEDLTDEGTRP